MDSDNKKKMGMKNIGPTIDEMSQNDSHNWYSFGLYPTVTHDWTKSTINNDYLGEEAKQEKDLQKFLLHKALLNYHATEGARGIGAPPRLQGKINDNAALYARHLGEDVPDNKKIDALTRSNHTFVSPADDLSYDVIPPSFGNVKAADANTPDIQDARSQFERVKMLLRNRGYQ